MDSLQTAPRENYFVSIFCLSNRNISLIVTVIACMRWMRNYCLSFILCFHLQLYFAHDQLDQSLSRECQHDINLLSETKRTVNFSNAIRSTNENNNKKTPNTFKMQFIIFNLVLLSRHLLHSTILPVISLQKKNT